VQNEAADDCGNSGSARLPGRARIETPMGNYKQHDNVEAETSMSVTYIRVQVDGTDVVEVDVLANIYKVDGVDLLGAYKANIGG